jgi:hypothetical protein
LERSKSRALEEERASGESRAHIAERASGWRRIGGCVPVVVRLLDRNRYERRLVLEQDHAMTGTEPPVDGGPALDVARSIEFLFTPAPRRERVSLQ